jgi:glycosyltransferase involved in cell wall biosynthesis
MRIGFDLRPFIREETGVGTYLRHLLGHLALVDRTNEYFLFSSSWRDRFPREKIPSLARMTFKDWRIPVKILNLLWQRWSCPPLDLFFRADLDLTHSATPLVLPTRGKKVITIHDLFFMDFPEQAGKEAGGIFRRRAADSICCADGIITFSLFTRNDLVSRFDINEDKVKVIPHGLDRKFLADVPPAELKAARKRLKLPPSFLLFVGAQVPRKNLAKLIDALKILHLRRIKIAVVLAGPAGEATGMIRQRAETLELKHWVDMTGYLPERDIRYIYRLASAFVFPSLCEGFGLPLVEAMASGIPVAASRTSAIPEVCGDAALYFQPENPEDMAEKIGLILEDQAVKQDLVAKGLKRAREFSWERAAADTLGFYGSLAAKARI